VGWLIGRLADAGYWTRLVRIQDADPRRTRFNETRWATFADSSISGLRNGARARRAPGMTC